MQVTYLHLLTAYLSEFSSEVTWGTVSSSIKNRNNILFFPRLARWAVVRYRGETMGPRTVQQALRSPLVKYVTTGEKLLRNYLQAGVSQPTFGLTIYTLLLRSCLYEGHNDRLTVFYVWMQFASIFTTRSCNRSKYQQHKVS